MMHIHYTETKGFLFDNRSSYAMAIFETGYDPGPQANTVFETGNELGTPGCDMKFDHCVKIPILCSQFFIQI